MPLCAATLSLITGVCHASSNPPSEVNTHIEVSLSIAESSELGCTLSAPRVELSEVKPNQVHRIPTSLTLACTGPEVAKIAIIPKRYWGQAIGGGIYNWSTHYPDLTYNSRDTFSAINLDSIAPISGFRAAMIVNPSVDNWSIAQGTYTHTPPSGWAWFSASATNCISYTSSQGCEYIYKTDWTPSTVSFPVEVLIKTPTETYIGENFALDFTMAFDVVVQ